MLGEGSFSSAEVETLEV
jgi:hypothetical protein